MFCPTFSRSNASRFSLHLLLDRVDDTILLFQALSSWLTRLGMSLYDTLSRGCLLVLIVVEQERRPVFFTSSNINTELRVDPPCTQIQLISLVFLYF